MKSSEKEDVLTMAYATYKENYLKWVVLELLATSKPLGNKEILKGVIEATKTNSEVHWEATIRDIDKAVRYLATIALIDVVENEEKATATEKGIDVLRNGVYQNLANSSLFGYKGLASSCQSLDIAEKAYDISVKACQISKRAYWIAIFAGLLALATLVVTVLK